MKNHLTISAVSDATGIAKEVLRKWEVRYGFPTPVRDDIGVRRYSAEHIERLKLLKKLIGDGMRPGQVVPLDASALASLIEARCRDTAVVSKSQVADDIIQWLKSHDPELLRTELRRELMRLGLPEFILTAMPDMNRAVGDAWARGDISIKDEHLYTESVHALVRTALSPLRPEQGSPRILLTTFTGELHSLGTLMVETLRCLCWKLQRRLSTTRQISSDCHSVRHSQKRKFFRYCGNCARSVRRKRSYGWAVQAWWVWILPPGGYCWCRPCQGQSRLCRHIA
jgi:DNA-binding transcriptional MerR regulator